MSAHTAGPWFVGSKFTVGPHSHDDDQTFGMVIPVADVYGSNREADARLIASAPNLLEAMLMVVHGLKRGSIKSKQIMQGDENSAELKIVSLHELLSDVIAKATGGAV